MSQETFPSDSVRVVWTVETPCLRTMNIIRDPIS